MLRRYLLLVLMVGTLAAHARAQTGSGTIYYKQGFSDPRDVYRVRGDGSGNTKLGSIRAVECTSLDTYPGGRQFWRSSAILGPIPQTSMNYGDIQTVGEQNGATTTVTGFRGPQYIDQNGIRIRCTNDQADGFFTFVVYDSRISAYLLVAHNGPVSEIFRPGFVPFSSTDDSRLTVLSVWDRNYDVHDWDPTGTWLTLRTWDASGRMIISLYNAQTDVITEVNNPAVSGLEIISPWCSPTQFRLFSPATYRDGTRGIVAFDPLAQRWNWVIKEGGGGSKQISSFTSVAISPDGTTLAFGMLRVVTKQISNPSLVRISVQGGSYTPLVTISGTNINTIDAGGLGWKW